MNSRYPDDPGGTQTDRASYVITKEVVEQCDHLIDLHGGDLDENLRPYSYWTVTGNQKQDEQSRAMLLAFGLDHIIISDRPRRIEGVAVPRQHRQHARQRRRSPPRPAAPGPVVAGDVAALVNGSLGTMKHLKMLASTAKPVAKPVWVEGKIVSVPADREGVFHASVDRDAHVAKGADRVRHRLPEPAARRTSRRRGRDRDVHSGRAVVEER